MPSETIAIGRFPVQFTGDFKETRPVDTSAHWDREAKIITSVTNELVWLYGEKQYVSIN